MKKEKRGKKTISIKTHLLFLVVIAMVIVATFLSIFNSVSSYNMLKTTYEADSLAGSEMIQQMVTDKLSSVETIAKNTAEFVNSNGLANLDYIVSLQSMDNSTAVLVSNRSGITAYGSNTDINQRAAVEYFEQSAGEGASVAVLDGGLYAISGQKILSTAVIALNRIDDNEYLDSLKSESGNEYTVFLGTTRVATTVMNNGSRQVGTEMSNDVAETVINQGQTFSGRAKIQGARHISVYTPLKDASGAVVGALFCGHPLRSLYDSIFWSVALNIAVGAALCLVAVFIAIRRMRTLLFKPMNRIAEFCAEVDSGNLGIAQALDDTYAFNADDELGKTFSTVRDMVQGLQRYIGEIRRILEAMSAGDLTETPKEDYKGDFASIRASLENHLASLNNAFSDISASAIQASNGADQVSAGAQALSQGATQQAASVEELASTIQDISDNVKATAANTVSATAQVQESYDLMEHCDSQVQGMKESMTEINNNSQEIGKIIKTIEDIAFQTNILALNAAVEAARAGEAGKGFAVVADEVRNLASKSAEASKETAALIAAAVSSVEQGTVAMDATAESMGQLREKFAAVASIVSDISSAAEQQSVALDQVSQGVDQISSVVQTNSATSEESAAASEELAAQAQVLNDLVSQFKLSGSSVMQPALQKQPMMDEPSPMEYDPDPFIPDAYQPSVSYGDKY